MSFQSRKSAHEESVDRRATDSDTSTEDGQPKQGLFNLLFETLKLSYTF